MEHECSQYVQVHCTYEMVPSASGCNYLNKNNHLIIGHRCELGQHLGHMMEAGMHKSCSKLKHKVSLWETHHLTLEELSP